MFQTTADFSYPNTRGVPGEVLVYTCPRAGCSRRHRALLPVSHEHATTTPPCGGGIRGRAALTEVWPPPAEHRLSAPPLAEWEQRFEAERVRARGGRPTSAAASA